MKNNKLHRSDGYTADFLKNWNDNEHYVIQAFNYIVLKKNFPSLEHLESYHVY